MGIDIAPVKGTKSYEWKQPGKDYLPTCPFRMIISGPSGTGKGVLTQNLLLSNECYMGVLRTHLLLLRERAPGPQPPRDSRLRRAGAQAGP